MSRLTCSCLGALLCGIFSMVSGVLTRATSAKETMFMRMSSSSTISSGTGSSPLTGLPIDLGQCGTLEGAFWLLQFMPCIPHPTPSRFRAHPPMNSEDDDEHEEGVEQPAAGSLGCKLPELVRGSSKGGVREGRELLAARVVNERVVVFVFKVFVLQVVV